MHISLVDCSLPGFPVFDVPKPELYRIANFGVGKRRVE